MNASYLAVCLAGAVVLSVEAIQQFRKPTRNMALDRFSILRGVEIDALCTVGERARGAAFYVGIYLVIYLVLIGSDQLFQIFLTASGNHAGPTGTAFLADNSLTIDGLDLGKPFFIATAIMVAMVSGILAPLERGIRSIAHRAANIPNGVFRIVDELEKLGLDQEGDGDVFVCEPGHLRSSFDRQFADGKGWLLPTSYEDLRGFLNQIDLLQPAVAGGARNRLFSAAATASLVELRGKLTEAHAKLSKDLVGLEDRGDAEQSQFHRQAADLRDNIMAVFAVQFIRNGRSVTAMASSTTNRRDQIFVQIGRRLRSAQEANIDSLFGATLACAFGSFLSIALLYVLYVRFALSLPKDADRFPPPVVDTIVNQSIGFALTASLMCFFSGYLTLMIRDIRREQGKWESWKLKSPPFSRLVLTAILPGAVGMVVVGLVLLAQDFLLSRIATTSQLIYFVEDKALYLAFFWPLSACVAFGVLLATDQHNHLTASDTIRHSLFVLLPAGVLSLLCVIVAVPNRTSAQEGVLRVLWTLREALFLLVPVAIFLAAYAWLLERSESRTER